MIAAQVETRADAKRSWEIGAQDPEYVKRPSGMIVRRVPKLTRAERKAAKRPVVRERKTP